ncbi:glycoside hydrolase family 20 protein [Chitinophaga caseinilytica]|uniref:beta-N-acetylhexosaminidase n=1 Tax=Chitinophaga caseinilytica TaxID=2267521 RepID=A0ABZ2Z8V3_9BACT
MTIKTLVIALLALAGLASCGTHGPEGTAPKAPVQLIPMPARLTESADSFLLDKQTVLVAATPADRKTAELFNEWFKSLAGFELKMQDSGSMNAIVFRTRPAAEKAIAEAYRLKVGKDVVTIDGDDEAGTFYGMQTLIQLLPVQSATAYWLPGVDISDQPRFAYRGLHLDVSRHFFPVSFVKKYIDLLAMHKMNTFHWHLTDDQGWRIEIKRYPKLQEIASRRKETLDGRLEDNKFDGKPYGGFYTQEDIKDVVQYATDRHVTVIPEIEMPGHALAALAAYPSLGCTGGPYSVGTKWGVFDDVFCAGNDSTFLFLQNVLEEVMILFPSKYIHIGGDECPKVRWDKCPKCQARMKANGLKDGHALQSYFIQRMEKWLNEKGRQIIGWDEILEGGLAPNATVMSWRGMEGGITAAKQHHDVIMTPGNFVYFDYYQSLGKNEPLAIGGLTPVSKVYSFEPVPEGLSSTEAAYIKGAQANLWTEYIGSPEHAEYMVYPRAVALAEVLWSPKDKKDYDGFLERLKRHLPRLDKKAVNYAKHVFEVRASVENAGKNGVQVKLDSKLDGGKIVFTTDSSAPDAASTPYTGPIPVTKTETIRATVLQDGKPYGNDWQQSFVFHKAMGKTVTLAKTPHQNYNPGPFALVNGIEGVTSFTDNQWTGYSGGTMEAVVDLGDSTDIAVVGLNYLANREQWIYPPKEIVISVSEDGKHYKEVMQRKDPGGTGIIHIRERLQEVKGRYVKFTLRALNKIPDGAPGEGQAAWLFVDELIVQ